MRCQSWIARHTTPSHSRAATDSPLTQMHCPIDLADAHHSGGADALGLEEDPDLPDDLLLRPCLDNAIFALGSDTLQFEKSLWFLLDHVEHLFTNGPNLLFAKCGPMSLTMPEPRSFSMPSRLLDENCVVSSTCGVAPQ